MDIVYWYYLGSDDNAKVVKRLNDIIEKIELFNYSKEGKYEIFIDAMFGIERFKKTLVEKSTLGGCLITKRGKLMKTIIF